jgi:AraC-like DNA-binding protein
MLFNAYSGTDRGVLGLYVRSAGHIFAENGRRISRPAGREDWLLFYVAKGSERFFLTSEEDATEGSFILFAPGERQEHICRHPQTSEFYYIHFSAPPGFCAAELQTSRVYHATPSARVREGFEQVIFELQSKEACFAELCAAKLLELLALLARRTAKEPPHTKEAGQIAAAVQTINREYHKSHTLEDYARLCSMSKFYFLKLFKGVTGSTPIEYRNAIRIEHAKALLQEGLPVGEVGAQLGFSSPAYFCDAFKKRVGCSPNEYRKSLQGK